MAFKKNITITLACIITECLVSFIPMICIIYIFFIRGKMGELVSTLLIVPYLIVIVNIVLLTISLIAQIFIKTKYYIQEDVLRIRTNNDVQEIKYSEIGNISYDFGDITKFNTKPSKLVVFNKGNQELLLINNPPMAMVYMLKKKCKTVKFNYYHHTRFLYLLALINLVGIVSSIVIACMS